MILFVGQVGARHARARGVPGTRLSRGLRHRWPNGRPRSTTPRASPRSSSRAFTSPMQRPPGPGRDRAAGGHAGRARRGAGRATVRAGGDWPGRRHDPACRSCSARPSARWCWSAAAAGRRRAARRLRRFAERFALPVAHLVPPRHLFDADASLLRRRSRHRANPKLWRAIKEADLMLLIGGRMGEMPSQGYTLFDIPDPRRRLCMCIRGAEEFGRVYQPRLAINATPTAFAARSKVWQPPNEIAWGARTTPRTQTISPGRGSRRRRRAAQSRRNHGLAAGQSARRLVLDQRRGQFRALGPSLLPLPPVRPALAPTSGSMGYGLPAAVGDKRLYPEPPVVCFAGDGDFLMNGQEFATAMQYDLPIIVVLIDNGMYGTIRMHQERDIPDGSARPSCAIPTSPPMRARLAATAKPSKRPRISRRIRKVRGRGQTLDPACQGRPGRDHAERDAHRHREKALAGGGRRTAYLLAPQSGVSESALAFRA